LVRTFRLKQLGPLVFLLLALTPGRNLAGGAFQPQVDAGIQVVWPHDGEGHPRDVAEAPWPTWEWTLSATRSWPPGTPSR
jgi:hypothetical protein